MRQGTGNRRRVGTVSASRWASEFPQLAPLLHLPNLTAQEGIVERPSIDCSQYFAFFPDKYISLPPIHLFEEGRVEFNELFIRVQEVLHNAAKQGETRFFAYLGHDVKARC
jgi:hypothetical protein